MTEKASPTCKVIQLTPEQMQELHRILKDGSWELTDAPYCVFKTKRENISIAAYTSGKLVIQGKGTAEFLEFLLEPQVLKEAAFTSPDADSTAETVFTPHAGIDESGKGDFFGPLVIACAFVADETAVAKLTALGVRDSKAIKSDARITEIAAQITPILHGKTAIVAIGPEAYNRAYAKIGSLNRLLAWGHARALENLLQKAPECTEALADKFGEEHLIRNALMEKGRAVELIQRTKAESDIAVGAASILARSEFVRRMNLLSEECGITLPKGAGPGVERVAGLLVEKGGREILERTAKMHFRTAYRVLGLPEPEKKDWRLFRKKTENRQILQGKWEF